MYRRRRGVSRRRVPRRGRLRLSSNRYGLRRRRTHFRRRIRRFGGARRRYRRFRRRHTTRRSRRRFLRSGRNQVAVAQYGQTQQVAALTGGGPACEYFTTERYDGTLTKATINLVTLNGNFHLALLADILWQGNISGYSQDTFNYNNVNTNTDINSHIRVHGRVKYIIRNMANETESYTMYVCKARKNVNVRNGAVTAGTLTTYQNIYDQLALGFATNGLAPGASTALTNDTMFNDIWSPFQSSVFCENFKITKVRSFKVAGGADRSFTLASRPIVFRPRDYFYIFGTASPNNWRSCDQIYLHNKYEKFVLFKLHSRAQLRNAGQGTYSQNISNDTPRYAMTSLYKYKFANAVARQTPYAFMDSSGFSGTVTAGNNTINEATYTVSQPLNASS